MRELAAVERAQYLRGLAGILYGDGSPGGLVNLVLKKPLPVRRHELSLGGGELGFRRTTVDSTGPIGEGRGVRYRLVAAAEGLADGYDNDESPVSVLPMLSFDLGGAHDAPPGRQVLRPARPRLPALRPRHRGDPVGRLQRHPLGAQHGVAGRRLARLERHGGRAPRHAAVREGLAPRRGPLHLDRRRPRHPGARRAPAQRPHRGVRPTLSLYASYAEGFEPGAPGQYLEDGRALDPVESRSLEAGVKAELLGERLAGFGIRQTNVTEADTRGFYRQIAEGESRGVEAEIVGSPARGLVARAGYAWTRAEITDDAAGFSGNALPNAPEHKANAWMRYRLPGRLRHLALAAGVVHVSERFAARDNRVRIPPYTRLDASAFVDMGSRVELALVAQNFTNARYVTSGMANFFAGPPRRLAATLTTRF